MEKYLSQPVCFGQKKTGGMSAVTVKLVSEKEKI